MNDHYDKWNRYSPLGLLILGLGMSLIGDATITKAKGRRGWVFKGTLGLVLFNAGLAVFSEAVKARALYEVDLAERIRERTSRS